MRVVCIGALEKQNERNVCKLSTEHVCVGLLAVILCSSLSLYLVFFCSYFPHHLWGGLDSALFPNSFLPLSSSRVKSLRNMESSKRSTSGVGSQDKGRNIRKTGNKEQVKMPTGFEKS